MLVKNNNFVIPKIADKSLGQDIAKSKEDMMMNELKQLDKAYKAIKDNRLDEYKSSLPDSLDLERMTYDGPSEDELYSQVEDRLTGEYENLKNELLGKIDTTRAELNSNKDKLSKTQENSLAQLEKSYNRIKESVGNQALKQGIARSSIVANKITEADIAEAEKAGIIKSEVSGAVEKIDSEIEELENKKKDSLSAYDLSYAIEIQKELDKLLKDRDKMLADVVDYNNKISQKEADFEQDKVDKIEDYKDKIKKDDKSNEEFYNKYGYYPDAKDDYEERYAMAHKFYMDLPKDTAKRLINKNSELENYLGSKYYNQLKTIVVMRK